MKWTMLCCALRFCETKYTYESTVEEIIGTECHGCKISMIWNWIKYIGAKAVSVFIL